MLLSGTMPDSRYALCGHSSLSIVRTNVCNYIPLGAERNRRIFLGDHHILNAVKKESKPPPEKIIEEEAGYSTAGDDRVQSPRRGREGPTLPVRVINHHETACSRCVAASIQISGALWYGDLGVSSILTLVAFSCVTERTYDRWHANR